MTSALAFKELRETIGIALAGLAVLMMVALSQMGWTPLPWIFSLRGSGIPFVSDGFLFYFGLTAATLALVLGLRQSIGDFWGEAHLFLLTRPVDRASIYMTKLAVGLAVYLSCAALPIAIYAWWAATPGTHASPFFWSMTLSSWTCWLGMTAIYLGAFLTGVRPGAWMGTRLAPLAAAAFAATVAISLEGWMSLAIIAVTDLLLILAIRFAVVERDFA